MKELFLVLVFLGCGMGLMAQSQSGHEELTPQEAIQLTDNDLSEALDMKLIELKNEEIHEAFNENPGVLAAAIRSTPAIAAKFRQYLATQDQAEKSSLESELLALYD